MRITEGAAYDLGAGVAFVAKSGAADDYISVWVDGEAFPRLVILPSDSGTGGVRVGNGTVFPATALGGGGSTVARGTLAARPAASGATLNMLYFATDVGIFYFSDGASWFTCTLLANGVAIIDAGNYFTGTDIEAALQEAGASLATKASIGFAIAMAVALG